MTAIQSLGHVAKGGRQFIGQLLCGFALVPRRLEHFLAMVIGACGKIYVFTIQAVVTGNRIRGHHLIGMPNMWLTIWVRNCSTYIKILICHFNFSRCFLPRRIGQITKPIQNGLLFVQIEPLNGAGLLLQLFP